MPRYLRFEDLPVWQEAARLYNAVLDLSEKASGGFSIAFRSQLDRAALSVSNNIAEGFERMSTAELLGYLEIARGSAGEVRSMIAVIQQRKSLRRYANQLDAIKKLAESCSKQIGSWMMAIERSAVKGKRHLTPKIREQRERARKGWNGNVEAARHLPPEGRAAQ